MDQRAIGDVLFVAEQQVNLKKVPQAEERRRQAQALHQYHVDMREGRALARQKELEIGLMQEERNRANLT